MKMRTSYAFFLLFFSCKKLEIALFFRLVAIIKLKPLFDEGVTGC